MAIIEDVQDSDEELLSESQNARHSENEQKPGLADGTSLTRLVVGKKRLQKLDLSDIIDSKGLEATFHDLCQIVGATLHHTAADTLDINRLERCISLFRFLSSYDKGLESLEIGSEQFELIRTMYDLLVIPCEFMTKEFDSTPEITQKLSYWRAGSVTLLQLLQILLSLPLFAHAVRSDIGKQADLLITLSRFVPTANCDINADTQEWSTPLSCSLAHSLISSFSPLQPSFLPTHSERATPSVTSHSIAKHILLYHLKPLFSNTPHTSLHPETGRKLSRIRGGDLFSGSWVDGTWKGKSRQASELGAIGSWKVLGFVINLLELNILTGLFQPGDMEYTWPLLIPPLLTLLDDHEARYRTQGIINLMGFLKKCPAILLIRTGLGDLIQKSLTTTYSFTSTVDNVPMIHTAVHANLKLVELLYPTSTDYPPQLPLTTPRHLSKHPIEPIGLQRFNILCSLYQNTVITYFAYSSDSVPYMTLAFSLIPHLLSHLHKGCIRYLSDTLPSICTSLGGSEAAKRLGSLLFTNDTIKMHIEAVRALRAFVKECTGTGRIQRWRGMLLSAVATLWYNLQDLDENKKKILGSDRLQDEMQKLMSDLEIDVGKEARSDFQRILSLDAKLFGKLFPQQDGQS